ncbi:uncharacterized protein RJT20DRAFT_134338 [Scheffersomyces xylosifermentans]|uniref:uncharacterized protein n=1 Tax=Scheffersomyces xylosifermentans TaxID=1304137 RepID=UPI00315D0C9F
MRIVYTIAFTLAISAVSQTAYINIGGREVDLDAYHNDEDSTKYQALSGNEESDSLDSEVQAAGLFNWVKTGRKKTTKLIKVLKDVLGNIKEIIEIKNRKHDKDIDTDTDDSDDEEGEDTKKSLLDKAKGWGASIMKRDLVDDLLVKVFVALKDSGLINAIIKMSLTDDKVRASIVDITVDLIEADVIPYEEIFVALKDSGLAIDVIKASVLDPETRAGVVALITELIPDLLKSGAISPKDLLSSTPPSKVKAATVSYEDDVIFTVTPVEESLLTGASYSNNSKVF